MASFLLSVFALFAAAPAHRLTAGPGHFANVFDLIILGVAGALVYTLVLFAGLRISGVMIRLKRPRL